MTITPILDTRTTRKNNLYPIFIRICHGKKQRLIPTGYKIEEKYWSKDKVIKLSDAGLINSKIAEIVSNAKTYYAECKLRNRTIRIENIGTGISSHSLNKYLEHRSDQYEAKEQLTMARKVRRQAFELTECFGADLYFDDIVQDHLRKLDAWLIREGNHPNTRADKFEKLSQFFSAATSEGKATIENPFKKYKIVRKPVAREKLTTKEIAVLEKIKLKGAVNDARNLFLFSYYCKGVRFENCIFCKRSDIREKRIYFRTNKGNKFISVRIHNKLHGIIMQYRESEFIFPYVNHTPKVEKERIKIVDTVNVIVNRNLKIVAGIARIEKPLTMHIARHSFAFHLKNVTENINIIQESLGHSSQRTTVKYLKDLDDQAIDKEMDKLYGG